MLGALHGLAEPYLPFLSFLHCLSPAQPHGFSRASMEMSEPFSALLGKVAGPAFLFRCHTQRPDPADLVLQVPYARSEAHLTELLERVCEKMKEYGEKVDPSTHRKSYVRVISHDGTKMDLSGVKIDGDVASSLKFAVRAGTKPLWQLLGLGGGFG